MKDYFKNLLPKKTDKGDALNYQQTISELRSSAYKASNTSCRFPFRFRKLTNIFSRLIFVFMLAGFLLGYYPTPTFPPVKKSVVHAQNEQRQEIIASAFPEPVQLPHPGYLSTHFSNYHPGVDIASGLGMPIHPIYSGIVENVIYDIFAYGHHVSINHQNGFKSLYAHMGRVYVKKGDKVNSSTTLGEVGLTGRSSGPHTHLEITKDGRDINPLTILPQIPDMPASASASTK